MAMLYYHAVLRNYAVVGTDPRTENERTLGFFVKHVDGGEDANPNLQLFKTRIYQPVQYLDVPQEVQSLQRYIWH